MATRVLHSRFICAILRYMSNARRFAATENLFATLERRERSRSWLARKIGVSNGLIYFLSQGQRTLSFDKAARAAAILDEPMEWLFRATDETITNAYVAHHEDEEAA